jgi:hypothetical protein
LLDWIYLSRQEGLPTPLDELHLQFLDRGKLLKYGERFPRTVRETVKEILVCESLSIGTNLLLRPMNSVKDYFNHYGTNYCIIHISVELYVGLSYTVTA